MTTGGGATPRRPLVTGSDAPARVGVARLRRSVDKAFAVHMVAMRLPVRRVAVRRVAVRRVAVRRVGIPTIRVHVGVDGVGFAETLVGLVAQLLRIGLVAGALAG